MPKAGFNTITSLDWERINSEKGYRRIGHKTLPGGEAYLAERVLHDPERGTVFQTTWAVGPDPDHLEVGQTIDFDHNSWPQGRWDFCWKEAQSFLALRDYGGDPGRR